MPTAPVVSRTTLLLATLALSACGLRGSGTLMTETRELEAFDSIEVGGAFELVVHVEPGTSQRVEVSADDNIVPEIVTSVSAGELEVSVARSVVRPRHPMKLEIWVASLVELELSGASDATVEGLHGERFELELSGASDSRISGKVGTFEIESSGASDLNARELQAEIVELELSGAGDVELFASERLDADVSGAGSVRYWGAPKQVNQDVSGAGSVEPGA